MFYSYIFGLYFISLTELMTHKQWKPKYGYVWYKRHLYTNNYVLGLNIVSSWMCWFYNYLEEMKVLNSLLYFTIDSSHTNTWILIWLGIYNPNWEFGICFSSQTTIDLRSQYYFNDVPKSDYKSLYYEFLIHWSPSKYNPIIGTQSTFIFFRLCSFN